MRKERGLKQSELAKLIGLKQPNLSRIENGLVEPRQATLEKLAGALSVPVAEFFSETRLAALERRFGPRLSPPDSTPHTGESGAAKTTAIPVFDTSSGYQLEYGEDGNPTGVPEMILCLPALGGNCFGLRVFGDAMETGEGPYSFAHGEVVVFADGATPKPGEFALVRTAEQTLFRRVFFDEETWRLVPLNHAYPECRPHRGQVRRLWGLAAHLRLFG